MLPIQFPLTFHVLESLIKSDEEINKMCIAAKASKFHRMVTKMVDKDGVSGIEPVIATYEKYDLTSRILTIINPMMEKLRDAAQTGKTSLSISDEQFYPPRVGGKLKPCRVCIHRALDIACTILKSKCAIQYKETHEHLLPFLVLSPSRELTWSLTNPHLLPPPLIERSKTLDVRKAFFESLLYQEEGSDVRIELDDDGKERAAVPAEWKITIPDPAAPREEVRERKVLSLPVHKVLLVQAEMFKRMFTVNMKEKRAEMPSIPLFGYRYEIVDALLQFLYKGSITRSFFYSSLAGNAEALNVSDVLELLRLSDYIQFTTLQKLCLEKLGQGISAENFLMYAHYQVASGDEYISRLLKWFVQMNPKFDQDCQYDLSDYTHPYSMIELYAFARSFHLEGLVKKAVEHSTTIFKYDKAFIGACKRVEESTNKELLLALKELVKCNPDFSSNLKANKNHFLGYASACAEL